MEYTQPDDDFFDEDKILTPEWEKYALTMLNVINSEISERNRHIKEYSDIENEILKLGENGDLERLKRVREIIALNKEILPVRLARKKWCLELLGLGGEKLNS